MHRILPAWEPKRSSPAYCKWSDLFRSSAGFIGLAGEPSQPRPRRHREKLQAIPGDPVRPENHSRCPKSCTKSRLLDVSAVPGSGCVGELLVSSAPAGPFQGVVGGERPGPDGADEQVPSSNDWPISSLNKNTNLRRLYFPEYGSQLSTGPRVGRGQDGMLDGDEGYLGSAAGGQAVVSRGEVGVPGPCGRHGRDAQGRLEVFAQGFPGVAKRYHRLLDPCSERFDDPGVGVDLVHVQPGHERVVGFEPPGERVNEAGIFDRNTPRAIPASTSGLRSPLMRAASMFREKTPLLVHGQLHEPLQGAELRLRHNGSVSSAADRHPALAENVYHTWVPRPWAVG